MSNELSVRTEALYERTNDNIPNRDGNSYEVRYSVRYDLTPRDEVGVAIRGRRDASSADFEARSTLVGSLSYRQDHSLISQPGNWFWGVAMNYTKLDFGHLSKVYDATTAATLLSGNFTASGDVDGDTIALNGDGIEYAIHRGEDVIFADKRGLQADLNFTSTVFADDG